MLLSADATSTCTFAACDVLRAAAHMKPLGGETEGEMGTLGEGERQRGHVKRRTCVVPCAQCAGYAKPKAERRIFYVFGYM